MNSIRRMRTSSRLLALEVLIDSAIEMAKRAREVVDDIDESHSKRFKASVVDRLSRLSDELILRVLSCLPVAQLIVCQRYVPSLIR